MDKDTGRWVPAGRSKEPKLEVANLIPGQEYQFRVLAVNAEGESEPLEALESIIAKNPFGIIDIQSFFCIVFPRLAQVNLFFSFRLYQIRRMLRELQILSTGIKILSI